MARLHHICGFGIFGDGRLNRTGTVCSTDTGSHPLGRFNRHRKSGAELGIVVFGHQGQVQALTALAVHGQADQAATMGCHEVNDIRRYLFCRDD